MDESLLDTTQQNGSRGRQLTLPDSQVKAAQTQANALYYGFSIIAIGCALLVLIVVRESRAWRQLVWDVLHATGITDHKSLKDLVLDIMKIAQEVGR